jgi:transcription elongation factor GreA
MKIGPQPAMLDLKKKLQEEIAALEYELRNELPKEIAKARAYGDLSENAEYHAAKERQSYVSARLAQLHGRLKDLSFVDLSKIPTDRIGLGSTVVVYDNEKEAKATYKIVTSEDADAPSGRISTTSPIGRGLLNKQVGDEVRIQIPGGGARTMEVVRVRTIHEAD